MSKVVSTELVRTAEGRLVRRLLDRRGKIVQEQEVVQESDPNAQDSEPITHSGDGAESTTNEGDGQNGGDVRFSFRCAWCGGLIQKIEDAVYGGGQPRHKGECHEAYVAEQQVQAAEAEAVEKKAVEAQDSTPRTQDADRGAEVGAKETGSEETAMTKDETPEVKTPKKRGKPNPHEAQINEAIAIHEAGKETPVTVEFKNASDAKKGYRNLWASLRNRGYKASISVDGTVLRVRVVGSAKKGSKKAGKRGRRAKATVAAPVVGARKPGRPRKTTLAEAPATNSSGGDYLVRVKAGRGWSYKEVGTKQEVEAFLYEAHRTGSEAEVFERKPVVVKTMVEGL